MVKWQSITVASAGSVGIETITELYSLGYKPYQIQVLMPDDRQDDIFFKYCQGQQISVGLIGNDADMRKTPDTDILLCIGGLPFLLSSESISKFSHAINLHTGLTQVTRGRWQASWAILLDLPYTGYTWHHMSEKFDAGNIIHQQKIKILPDDTALKLNSKIFKLALQSLKIVLDKCDGNSKVQKKLGKYFDKKIPYGGIIDSSQDPSMIEKLIRAMYHPPYKPVLYGDCYVDSYEKYLEIKKTQ